MRRLSTKFLVVIGILSLAFSAVLLVQSWSSTRSHLEDLLIGEGELALEFDLAIREYVSESIRPEMQKRIGENEFIPEAMSTSFVAREVFDKVREKFPDYVLKFSSDNPRNPLNAAGPAELEILQYFRDNPKAKRWVGDVEIDGKRYVAHFSPRRLKESCLRCHGRPEDAPESLLERYGPENGYYLNVGDTIAMDTVAIPTDSIDAATVSQAKQQVLITAIAVVFFFLAIFFAFQRIVGRRLAAITEHFAQAVEHEQGSRKQVLTTVPVEGRDEISVMASAYNAMVHRLEKFHATLEQQVESRTEELQAEIRQRKQAELTLEKRIVALAQPLDNPEGLRLEELFNVEDIQHLQDDFATATGVASIITSADGTPITRPSNFCRLCSDIIRQTDKGLANCRSSDAALGRLDPNGPTVQPCMSGGLWDAGASISVGGHHVANWLVGQIRDETQTEENMRQYAREIGADEDVVIEAFHEVPTMSREQFEKVAEALHTIAQQLSTMAYQNVQQARFIAQHRQSEVELAVACDEAEAANHAKSEFLANMSHEIRTPMTAILGFSEILIERIRDREQLDAATTIRRNGEYLIGIINDILDLSKIESGKLEMEKVRCSPHQILSDVVSLMRVRAKAKDLPLRIAYEGPIPETIESDPTRLRQILINLTGNAIKFTEVGEVRLVARLLNTEHYAPMIQFKVADSGCGMTEDEIARLFEPFIQADTSTTRRFGGTGLGLAISKRLAAKLGGGISVESAVGEGSTLTVTVETGPLDGVKLLEHLNEAEAVRAPSETSVDHARELGCRILLAEDGPDNQRLISFLLKKAGAEVTVAENGQIACDLALTARDDGTPFDVILMDMQMPVKDGYDATASLRKAGYSGPIIALTAHAMSTDRRKCLDAGCDDYVTKPIDRAKLVSLVAGCVGARAVRNAGDAPLDTSNRRFLSS